MSARAPAVAQRVAVIGAGWAGCAAAVEATRRGHQVTLFESARTAGGRARRVDGELNGQPLLLDNGQHILIGAYTDTLALMRDVGVEPDEALLRLPLTLLYPNGTARRKLLKRNAPPQLALRGLRLSELPAPLDALVGIACARGWSLRDKAGLLRVALRWRLAGFSCAPHQSVAQLCRGLSPTIMAELMEPLCVSALNTPAARASGQVFLRVLQDSLFGGRGGSNLLLPRQDLSALLPSAALSWLASRGACLRLGERVTQLRRTSEPGTRHAWALSCAAARPAESFDQVILACASHAAARLVANSGLPAQLWLERAAALTFEAITTVYTQGPGVTLPLPMLALSSDAVQPAQFVFDRGQLGGPAGLLAWVVSASGTDSEKLTAQVLTQARRQLGLTAVVALQTIVEKRATFACTPALQRPPAQVVPQLWACGDYVDGPYPATLEGAVRSGLAAARAL